MKNNLATILVIFFAYTLLAQDSTAPDLVNPNASPLSANSNAANPGAQQFATKFMCAAEILIKSNASQNSPAMNRAKYFSEILGDFYSRMSPPPSDTWQRHLTAQMMQETGSLSLLTEKPSQFASSRLKHKGRGGIQITHAANYALFSGFFQEFKRSSGGSIDTAKLVSASANQNGVEVTSPDTAFDENSQLGKERNVLAGVWYFLYNSAKHPKLKSALEKSDSQAVTHVGQAINRGPGAIGGGAEPHGASVRQDNFKKIEKCYNNSSLPPKTGV